MPTPEDRDDAPGPLRAGEPRLLGLMVAVGVGAFALARLALFLVYRERFAEVSTGTLARAFWVGARMDLSLLAFLTLPAWLLCFVPGVHWARLRLTRGLLVGWLTLVFLVLLFLTIADVVQYGESFARLNAGALDDLRHPDILWTVLRDEFGIVPVGAVLLLVTGAFAWWAARGVRRLSERPLVGRTRLAVALVAFVLLGLGGRLAGSVSTWWSSAYFSRHYSANQLALNGPYTLILAWLSEVAGGADVRERVEGIPAEQAVETVRALVLDPRETLTGGERAPLWRRVDTGRPERRANVIIVLMESFGARGVGCLGGRAQTPHFDRLAEDGVLFTRHYATGTRSNRGLSAVLAGLPGLPGQSVLRSVAVQRGVATLATVLRERGHVSIALHAGRSSYDNMSAFAIEGGYDRVIDRDDIPEPTFETEWGVCDEDILGRLLEECRTEAGRGNTFHAVALTQSNHRPYRIPPGRIEPSPDSVRGAEARDAFRYSDWAIGDFVARCRAEPWFDDTLFVFVADHGKDRDSTGGPDIRSFQVPLLFYAPAWLEPARIEHVASQADIAPTVLGLLGGSYEHGFLGSDLLGPRPPRRAMMVLGDDLFWYADGRVAQWSPGGETQLYEFDGLLTSPVHEPDVLERLIGHLRATARIAFSLPREGRYRSPEVIDD